MTEQEHGSAQTDRDGPERSGARLPEEDSRKGGAGGRELLVLAAWGSVAVFLCWDDVTWWRGELPGTLWGWTQLLAWPLVIYAYVGLVIWSVAQHLSSRRASQG